VLGEGAAVVELSLVTDEFVILRPTYWCVGLLAFAFRHGDVTDESILGALLSHPRYRDHYSSPDSATATVGFEHGPYDLQRLLPSHFMPVSDEQVRSEFASLLEDAGHYGASPEVLARAGSMAEALLRSDGHAYSLSRRDDIPWHSWGWVQGHEWHELVRIAPARGMLVDLLWFVD
jgi:hypothetical protein